MHVSFSSLRRTLRIIGKVQNSEQSRKTPTDELWSEKVNRLVDQFTKTKLCSGISPGIYRVLKIDESAASGAIHVGHKPCRTHVYTISAGGQTMSVKSISDAHEFDRIHNYRSHFALLGKCPDRPQQTISAESKSATDKFGRIRIGHTFSSTWTSVKIGQSKIK